MKDKITKFFNREWNIKPFNTADDAVQGLTSFERLVFYFLVFVFGIASFSLLWSVHREFLVEVPKQGGVLTEGMIGTPRFINPLLAISDADRDLSSLIYSGLLKSSSNGELVPNLAERYSISEDGLIYTFKIREDAKFHDGESVTTDDIIFTIEKAKDPSLKSPKRANWEGVEVKRINEKELEFVLKQPYSPFLENATLGILPEHIWKEADSEQFPFSQFNASPIGSGPYKIQKIKRNSAGIPIYYELSPFKDYTLGIPFINKVIVRFYSNSDSLLKAHEAGEIESMSAISPEDASNLSSKGANIIQTSLPRIFGVFFNSSQATLFTNKEVRQALDIALRKDDIVNEVLKGYGSKIEGPIPPNVIPTKDVPEDEKKDADEEEAKSNRDLALEILTKAGWKKNEETGIMEKEVKKEKILLSFSISTSNAPELKKVAEMVKSMWEEIGASVTINIFEPGDLNQNVIRPRKYDSLLFGEVIGRDLDLFAFWHSSQRNDPGLNIALYTNIKTDKLLEEARRIQDKDERLLKYREFENEVKKDIPAIFIYSPDFLYVVPNKLKGISLNKITVPGERFSLIEDWYIETEKVWSLFVNTQN